MAGLGTEDQDAECDKLSKEFDGIAIQKKTIEQFRTEIVDSIFTAIRKESISSVAFIESADYLNAKLSEARIEGLHKALSLMLDASTIDVTGGKDNGKIK